MALKLFEFVAQFMKDTFLLKLTQFEKTGSIRKTFISLGYLIINFHFRSRSPVSFTIFLFDSGVCLPFQQWKCTELKKKSQVKPRKIKIEREQIKTFLKKTKNQQDLYKSLHYVH